MTYSAFCVPVKPHVYSNIGSINPRKNPSYHSVKNLNLIVKVTVYTNVFCVDEYRFHITSFFTVRAMIDKYFPGNYQEKFQAQTFRTVNEPIDNITESK